MHLTPFLQAIADDSITCRFPSSTPGANRDSVELLNASIRYAQFSGKVTSTLEALRGSTTSLSKVFKTIAALETELQNWLQSLPDLEKLAARDVDGSLKGDPHTANIAPQHLLYPRFAYYSGLISIHSFALHPWKAIPFHVEPYEKEQFQKHVAHSSNVVVDACRKIIQDLTRITITVATPKWYVFMTQIYSSTYTEYILILIGLQLFSP